MRRTTLAAVVIGSAITMVLAGCGGSTPTSTGSGSASSGASPSASGQTQTGSGSGSSTGSASGSSAAAPNTAAPSGSGGAAAPTGDSADYASGKTFTTIVNADPGNLNPLLTNLVAAQNVGAYAYDSLVFTNPKNGAISQYLADQWTQSPTKVTFRLRKGITCSDGSAFTAQTAADNINYIVDPANKSPLAGSIIPPDAKTSVDAATNTLTVTTPEPSPFLLYNVGSQAMMCEKGIKDPSSVTSASDGTGMYVITEDVANDHVTLTKRDGVTWEPGGVTSATVGLPAKVVVKVMTNNSTVANLLLTGGLNAAAVAAPDSQRLSQFKYVSSTNMAGELLMNHYKGKPTADPAVRKALVQSVDWDAFVKIETGGLGRRATALDSLPPDVCHNYDSMTGHMVTFDAAKAAATLDAAGWKAGPGGVRSKDGTKLAIQLDYANTNPQLNAAVDYVQKQWQALGVDVTLKGGDINWLAGATFSSKDPSSWDVSIGVSLMSNTPSIFVPYFSGPVPPKGTNFMSIDNPGYNSNAKKAASLTGAAACQAWKDAEIALWQQTDLLPIGIQDQNTYLNGAASLYPPIGSYLAPAGIRMLK